MHIPRWCVATVLLATVTLSPGIARAQTVPRAADDSAALYRRSAVAAATAAARLQAAFRLGPEVAATTLVRAGYGVADLVSALRGGGLSEALFAYYVLVAAEAERDRGQADRHRELTQRVGEVVTLLRARAGSLEAVADQLVATGRATTRQTLAILAASLPTPRDFARAGARTRATSQELFTAAIAIPNTSLRTVGQALQEAGQTASQIFGGAMAAGHSVQEALAAALPALDQLANDLPTMMQMMQVMMMMMTQAMGSEQQAMIAALVAHYPLLDHRIAVATSARAAGMAPAAVVGGVYAVVGAVAASLQILEPAGWALTAIATGFHAAGVAAQSFVTAWAGMPGRAKGTTEAGQIALAMAQSTYQVATAAAMIALLQAAGYGATAVATGVAVLGVSAAVLATAMVQAGYTVAVVGAVLVAVVNATANVAASALLAAGASVSAVAGVLNTEYGLGFLAAANVLKAAQVPMTQVVQALTAVYGLTSSQVGQVTGLWAP